MIIKKIITILSRAVGLIFYCLCLYLFNKNYGDGIRAESLNLSPWKNVQIYIYIYSGLGLSYDSLFLPAVSGSSLFGLITRATS